MPSPSGGIGGLTFDFASDAGVPDQLVEQARAEARAVGYAQGWAHGLRDAADSQAGERAAANADRVTLRDRQQQQVASALQALQAAAADLRQSTMSITDDIEDQILAAAVEIAEALLGRELRDPEVAAPAALARVLRLAPANEPVTVWLHPADHRTLTAPNGTALIGSVEGATGRGLTFEIDPELQPGDARARCGSTSIDARLAAGVTRLREYLSR
ncbi:FliH/SctL family protein [Jatrophihabitans sp.]|uniref:FliH/SctL family protein n=1 Tax=Jatrophihabitans sp. TaxID=1932789 RepID=UPI002F2301EB